MPRGRKPGTPKTGGRVKGTPNKATADIKEVARKHGPAIIEAAAKLAGVVGEGDGKAESEQARIAAMTLVMGYGYGKPSQVLGNDPDNPLPEAPSVVEHRIVDPRS